MHFTGDSYYGAQQRAFAGKKTLSQSLTKYRDAAAQFEQDSSVKSGNKIYGSAVASKNSSSHAAINLRSSNATFASLKKIESQKELHNRDIDSMFNSADLQHTILKDRLMRAKK